MIDNEPRTWREVIKADNDADFRNFLKKKGIRVI
jgi:hypothetical protein